MIKRLIVILLLLSNFAFAQDKPLPTQFDKFVKKSNIEWAAYASDTFNFDNAGLNKLLLHKLANDEIKASLPVESRTAETNKINYSTKKIIDSAFYGDDADLVMDSAGNVTSVKKVISEEDNPDFRLTEITQILYAEKGKLKSYIPFVTPTVPVHTSTGMYIGERFYFTTCFNYKYNCKPRKIKKTVFLAQTKRMIPLNPVQSSDKLKEMYGNDLLETLWSYALDKKIDVISLETNTRLSGTQLNNARLKNEFILAPIWDSVNTINKYEAVRSGSKMEFTGIQLIQDWYYDAQKNKVSNTIIEAWLYAKKWKDDIEAKEASPVLKLVFK